MKKLKCPECNSTKLVKNGFGFTKRKFRQRYLCMTCLRNTMYPKGAKK